MSFETEAASAILRVIIEGSVVFLALIGGARIVMAVFAAILRELRRDLHDLRRSARGIRQEMRRLASRPGGVA